MSRELLRARLPGLLASGLMLVATGLWTFWGFMEMYYEGWGQPGLYPLSYLLVAIVFLAFWLLAEAWPRLGGGAIIAFGILFTTWILSIQIGRGSLSFIGFLSWLPVTVAVVLVGALFVADGRRRKRRSLSGAEWPPPEPWLRRNLRLVIPVATFVLVGVICTGLNWHVFSRNDDGNRGARLIQGFDVSLVWAPAGPGWAQSDTGFPGNLSWNQIALYGLEPVGFEEKPGYGDRDANQDELERYGLFRYLTVDGTTIVDEPQDIWRMATKEEIVRSLVRDGENAGCTAPQGQQRGQAVCRRTPDKETPLWGPDIPFIYMWAAQERDSARAYYVSYNGWVRHQPKSWGNPRHGYRFVREVLPEDTLATG